MNIRLKREKLEEKILSKYASLSSKSLGRDIYEKECDVRTAYQRDRDRILHSKAFRRLKHKTQVFLAPEGDHYRTRLTHTLEVSQISRTIARALNLNEDLVEAIALGHDLGHTPFGHAGEEVLNRISKIGFSHYKQSVRVVEFLEKSGKGLNLTKEVRDGILNHRTSGKPGTLEGEVVRLCDKIAYINHDIDDSLRAGIFNEKDLPKECIDVLGIGVRDRLDILIHDVIKNSYDKEMISMSEEVYLAMMKLRKWMFKNVYLNEFAKPEESKAKGIVEALYRYYSEDIFRLPKEYQDFIFKFKQDSDIVICDYIAGMTDSFAIEHYKNIFIPKKWKI